MAKKPRPIQLVIDTPDIKIYEGLAEQWEGREHVDLVLTNPYGPMPTGLRGTPMIIHQWVHRKEEAERWCGNKLDFLVGTWNKGQEAFWSANIEHPTEMSGLIGAYNPEPGGWYPEHMVRMILQHFALPGQTIWDGFMGRGTVGKIARELGMHYIGVEQLPTHIALARGFLSL